ncbi:MAG: hypothetical protein GYB65_02240 [Chloroflexi bacterium]|nr:hypothetical protein [Chloroflexota bacterium]
MHRLQDGTTAGGPHLVIAAEDMSSIDDKDDLRVTAINALHSWSAVDVQDGSDELISNVAYATASEPVEVRSGSYAIGVYSNGDSREKLVELDEQKLEAQTAVLWVFAEQQTSGNAWESVNITLETDAYASFGSPKHIGQLLFSRYVLPFEMVGLLLLVAMIGAIVLTHETLGFRRRTVRRLANTAAPVDEPLPREAGK